MRRALFVLPTLIALTLPSSADKDPLATGKTQVLAGEGHEVTAATQSDWIERYVPLLLAKAPVQVILWNQLSDAGPHHYPHGGLFDAEHQAKPALEVLRKIRQQLLL